MSYSRSPYCFQKNYSSSSYSGPSTSFHPTFENGGNGSPPSHCDVNEYQSPFSSNLRFPRTSSSFDSVRTPSIHTLKTRPSNLDAYIAATPREERMDLSLLEILIQEEKVACGGRPETATASHSNGSRIKRYVSNTKSCIKEGYKKSFGSKSSGKNSGPHAIDPDMGTLYGARIRGKYLFAQVDKKIYDAGIAAKNAAIKSKDFIRHKHRRSESQKFRDNLDRSYGNKMFAYLD